MADIDLVEVLKHRYLKGGDSSTPDMIEAGFILDCVQHSASWSEAEARRVLEALRSIMLQDEDFKRGDSTLVMLLDALIKVAEEVGYQVGRTKS